ncbi:MAG: hypothetical protein SCK57_08800 [Bacillota bacterium]|nr:hypothetical protein [Bacillota bacterium]
MTIEQLTLEKERLERLLADLKTFTHQVHQLRQMAQDLVDRHPGLLTLIPGNGRAQLREDDFGRLTHLADKPPECTVDGVRGTQYHDMTIQGVKVFTVTSHKSTKTDV